MKMNKYLIVVAAILLLTSSASLAVLKTEWINGVGMSTSTVSSDMGELDRALSSFASSHPSATVDSFQIVPHSASGSYDIFILYREE